MNSKAYCACDKAREEWHLWGIYLDNGFHGQREGSSSFFSVIVISIIRIQHTDSAYIHNSRCRKPTISRLGGDAIDCV